MPDKELVCPNCESRVEMDFHGCPGFQGRCANETCLLSGALGKTVDEAKANFRALVINRVV